MLESFSSPRGRAGVRGERFFQLNYSVTSSPTPDTSPLPDMISPDARRLGFCRLVAADRAGIIEPCSEPMGTYESRNILLVRCGGCVGGKLSILGAFDYSDRAGAAVQCAIALRLRFTRIEEGNHRIKITIVDEDGRSIMPELEGTMAVKFGADDDSAVTNFVINIQQLKLDKFGQYAIDLAVDSRHEASLPLVVKQVQNPTPPHP